MPPRADLRASLTRAFRLQIDGEPSITDRAALDAAGIGEPLLRAFLSWRRSLLLIAMVALAPVVLLRLIEVLAADRVPGTLRALALMPVATEAVLVAVLWTQLRHWTSWQTQRRVILRWWVVSFAAPFAVFLYPIDRAAAELVPSQLGAAASGSLGPMLGAAYLVQAVMVLGPKLMALPPGLMRGAVLTKLLLPGTSAPGWLVAIVAPVYAVLAYLLLLVPYQLTGSGYFLLALLGIAGAQLLLTRAGLRLARPSSSTEAQLAVTSFRATHLAALGAGLLFLLVALARLSDLMSVPWLAVFSMLLSLGANLLLATLVGTDLLISSLEPPRALGQEAQAQAAETQARILALTRGVASAPEAAATPPLDVRT